MATGLTIPPGAPATKQFFFPVQTSAARGDYRVRSVPDSTAFQLTWFVPHDFSSLTSVELICIPGAAAIGAGKSITLDSDYAAIGESFATHSESNPAFTTDFLTPDLIYGVDVSSVYNSLAAGDFCGLQITLNAIGDALDVLGVLLRYE